MTNFSWLLEDGSGRWQLEDGSGNWLLEEQAAHGGIEIVGTHANQQTIQRRRAEEIPVEFRFQLIAGIIKRAKIKLIKLESMLKPSDIYADKLRRSFVISLTELRNKLRPLTARAYKESLQEALESGVKELLEDPKWCFEFLYKLIKRKGEKNGN